MIYVHAADRRYRPGVGRRGRRRSGDRTILPDGRSGDDRVVSPVIGIVLIVTVTVVLAGVAGIFPLDTGEVDAAPAP